MTMYVVKQFHQKREIPFRYANCNVLVMFEHYVDLRSSQTLSHTYFVTEPVCFIQLSNIISKVFELLKLKRQR